MTTDIMLAMYSVRPYKLVNMYQPTLASISSSCFSLPTDQVTGYKISPNKGTSWEPIKAHG